MINISEEIAKLLGARCFANECSGPSCKLETFPKEIEQLIDRIKQEERQVVIQVLDEIEPNSFNRYTIKKELMKRWFPQ